ncbi:MAG TPA: DUF1569 domain-containing protein [Vicinamibacterales bacterium]|nr:DUF1569 domain-containing protein [Vicinamibacterales bacterium]
MKTLDRADGKAEILRRLRTMRPDHTRRWGRMSAHQMICHLADACRMAAGQKPVSDAAGRLPRPLVKWIALYLPVPWRSGILTRPEIDQLCDGTRPIEFAADVAEVEALLDLLTTRDDRFEWPRHPIFGRMSRADWLRWAYLHTDHHLRQFGA